jgi:hypothetical protein
LATNNRFLKNLIEKTFEKYLDTKSLYSKFTEALKNVTPLIFKVNPNGSK